MAERAGAHVIVLGNEKGGSGKTTTAFHLAVYSAEARPLQRPSYLGCKYHIDVSQLTIIKAV